MLGYVFYNIFIYEKWRAEVNRLLVVLGSRIDTEEAFYLYASGPDLTSIMPCKYGKPHGTLSKYVTQEGLQCEQIRELLMRNTDVDIAPLIVSHCTYEYEFIFSFLNVTFFTRRLLCKCIWQRHSSIACLSPSMPLKSRQHYLSICTSFPAWVFFLCSFTHWHLNYRWFYESTCCSRCSYANALHAR